MVGCCILPCSIVHCPLRCPPLPSLTLSSPAAVQSSFQFPPSSFWLPPFLLQWRSFLLPLLLTLASRRAPLVLWCGRSSDCADPRGAGGSKGGRCAPMQPNAINHNIITDARDAQMLQEWQLRHWQAALATLQTVANQLLTGLPMQANSSNTQLPLWDGMINYLRAKTHQHHHLDCYIVYCIFKMNENYWILFTLIRNFILLSKFLKIPAFLLSRSGGEPTRRSAVPSSLSPLATKFRFHCPSTLRLPWPL